MGGDSGLLQTLLLEPPKELDIKKEPPDDSMANNGDCTQECFDNRGPVRFDEPNPLGERDTEKEALDDSMAKSENYTQECFESACDSGLGQTLMSEGSEGPDTK